MDLNMTNRKNVKPCWKPDINAALLVVFHAALLMALLRYMLTMISTFIMTI